ncbi:MAG: radical SAM family heme chaperone HemW [Candidatus Onthovivens sp.]|nr:radical SAM family heme chaperone HemW [Candidatus Onthovivens sp.]
MQKKRKKKINSIYIHIPFCRSICPYCDFTKILKTASFEDLYIEQLEKDLSLVDSKFCRFNTIYIGGGTPSCLDFQNIEKILIKAKKFIKKNTEFTFECNIEDINEKLLNLLKNFGVNRLSIGIQSFKKDTLNLLKRNTEVDYISKIKLAKIYFSNINVDFIYGLPNETIKDIEDNLNIFLSLDIQHISIYSLTVVPGTIFYNKKIQELDDDTGLKIYKMIIKKLKDNKFYQYEVSNFSKKGYQSRHNLNYWNDNYYVGVGLGASGYIDNIRYTNTRNISSYIKGVNILEKEELDLKNEKEEFLMLNLRKTNGFLVLDYENRFHQKFFDEYQPIIEDLTKKQLLTCKNRCKFTRKGFYIQDLLLLKFFDIY